MSKEPTHLVEQVVQALMQTCAPSELLNGTETSGSSAGGAGDGGQRRQEVVGAEWWVHRRNVGRNLGHRPVIVVMMPAAFNSSPNCI